MITVDTNIIFTFVMIGSLVTQVDNPSFWQLSVLQCKHGKYNYIVSNYFYIST